MAAAAAASVASQARAVLRGLRPHRPQILAGHQLQLKYLVARSISEACNNSVLLLGPRGCRKGAVVDMVLEDLKKEHPDAISVVSSDGNTEFVIDILRECGLAHKTIIFVLEEFDLFAQFEMTSSASTALNS